MSRVTPYVPFDVVEGRLVRVCPDCGRAIDERTDDDGVVSRNFDAHYEKEHGPEGEPPRQRAYLLGGSMRFDGVDDLTVDLVRRQMPEVDWQLVRRIDDLPEGAPVLLARQVLLGMWATVDEDPQAKQVRQYRRQGDHLVFVPSHAQIEERQALMERASHLRRVFVHRYRDQVPKLRARTSAGVDRHLKRVLEIEAGFAKEFDEQRIAASKQFFSGDPRWLATLNSAIDGLGLRDEEIEEYVAYEKAKRAESLASLSARIDDPETPIADVEFLRQLRDEEFGIA